MARARSLKPKFFTNDKLAELPPLVRLLFAGLWCIADREGRLEDRPARIKVDVLPYDTCNVDRMLQQLHDHGFIRRYTIAFSPGSAGARYIQILTFTKHQNPHVKEGPSTIPAPDSAPCFAPDSAPGEHHAENSASTVRSTSLARLELDSGLPLSKPSVVPTPTIDARDEAQGNNAFDRKKNGKTERWDATEAGTDAKGRELGVQAKAGEDYFEYRKRLWGVINQRSRDAH